MTFQESPYLTECQQVKCQLTVVVSIMRQIVTDMEQSIIRYIYPASYINILLLYLSETG